MKVVPASCPFLEQMIGEGVVLLTPSMDVTRSTGLREDSALSPDTCEQPVSNSALSFPVFKPQVSDVK